MDTAETVEDLDRLRSRLSANEKRVLLALQAVGGSASPDDVLAQAGFKSLSEVMSATNWLADKGLVRVEGSAEKMVGLDEEGRHHATEGLPERRTVRFLQEQGGRATMADLASRGVVAPQEVPITLGWLKRKGWADISKEGGDTVLTLSGGEPAPGADELLLAILAKADMPLASVDKGAFQDLKGRKGLLREHEVVDRRIITTPAGQAVAAAGLEVKEEIVQLTAELIATGKWRERDIRPYDVHAFAPRAEGGKPHPLSTLIEEIREVFLEMGFEEIAGDYVESAFWNMDVLFIPQDHPAREMQDTFYLDHPKRIALDDAFVKQVAKVHETGGDTGSTGWGGTFSVETAERSLLRTHTTVGTVRYLYENPDAPCKVFSLGRVFRNETMDATHLPEFHQIEGIIKEPGANFRMLVGVLREFYRRMGFPKVRVRPGYFPYTEPSMEVDVFYNGRWMELGGSGIFRPEVTEPLGVKDPVCAWGLGLERLAMMRFGLKDIRDIYISDVEWLRHAPLHFE